MKIQVYWKRLVPFLLYSEAFLIQVHQLSENHLLYLPQVYQKVQNP